MLTLNGMTLPAHRNIAGALSPLLTLDIFAGAVVATAGAIAITLVLPNEIRGLAMGVDSCASAIFGAAGAPTAVALLSRYLGGEQHLGPAFVMICVPSALLSAVCLVFAMRNGELVRQGSRSSEDPTDVGLRGQTG